MTDPPPGHQKPWRRSWDAPTSGPHVRLLGERVVLSLQLKPEHWERCAGSPKAQPLLRGFLEGAAGQPPLLLVTLSLEGQLALSTKLPARPWPQQGAVSSSQGARACWPRPALGAALMGDLPASSLEHFAALVEEVRGPRAGEPQRHHAHTSVLILAVTYDAILMSGEKEMSRTSFLNVGGA
uniref:Uncharacterized protein n=1 Tax=Chelonoidis abingdonii TaxID=106734 RepID=A0A8C0IK16_CHEAB